jgi:hypothetical protein
MPEMEESTIDYIVVEVSSEEASHPATNLESSDTRGWLSKPGSAYPLSLLVHLKERFEVHAITLLPHQLYVSKKIELYMGDMEGDFKVGEDDDTCRADAEVLCREATFLRLGHLAFSSNEDNGFTVREQKTVRVKVTGSMLKIVFHEPHNVPSNHRRQVALISLTVMGKSIAAERAKSRSAYSENSKETSGTADPDAYFLGAGMSGQDLVSIF